MDDGFLKAECMTRLARAGCIALCSVLLALLAAGWQGRAAAAAAAITCTNLVQNGDMSSSSGWLFGLSLRTRHVHDGASP